MRSSSLGDPIFCWGNPDVPSRRAKSSWHDPRSDLRRGIDLRRHVRIDVERRLAQARNADSLRASGRPDADSKELAADLRGLRRSDCIHLRPGSQRPLGDLIERSRRYLTGSHNLRVIDNFSADHCEYGFGLGQILQRNLKNIL
jgi:hypothetical protein